jgi:hypothetical protein
LSRGCEEKEDKKGRIKQCRSTESNPISYLVEGKG